MNSTRRFHQPNALLLATLLLGFAGLMPVTGAVAETLFNKSHFSQLLDGDVQLAPVGQRAGLHMTFTSPSDSGDAFSAVHADRPGGSSGGVHLSVRMPWK